MREMEHGDAAVVEHGQRLRLRRRRRGAGGGAAAAVYHISAAAAAAVGEVAGGAGHLGREQRPTARIGSHARRLAGGTRQGGTVVGDV